MAVFAASFTVNQSADCTTLTLTDTSNYTDNSSSITLSTFETRQFIISNSDGAVISTINLTGGALVATYAITKDAWLSVELRLTDNTGPDFTKTNSVLSTCFLELCYSELVAKTDCDCSSSCGGSCGCSSVENDKVRLLQHIKAAEIFSDYSNPVLAQKQLDAGNILCEANENND